MMLQPSQSCEPIPGYVVKERIGVGGYGEVWNAQAPGGLAKAIKFVYGYFDDARAARELKALERIKQVRHPFLLSLERFEIVDGQLVIVTELAEMSLKDRFEQCRKNGLPGIPRDELLNYMRDAADALDYMSGTFSLQHLDVKPENLLLVGGRIKVADFGLVKDLHDATASLMSGLTPIYAPPEVFDDRPSVHSDQYSLAIVYQEMLTGVLPFPGRTPAQLASQHLHAHPRLAPLPSGDQPFVAKALSKNPDERFTSCRALVDCLCGAGTFGLVPPASAETAPPQTGRSGSDTTSTRSHAGQTDTKAQQGAGTLRPKPATTTIKTEMLEAGLGAKAVATQARVMQPAVLPMVDLPPLEVNEWTGELRPTLFIGIGGTARRTLRALRRRLRDQLGQEAAVPAIQMLFLDTDAASICQATQGDAATALADAETLHLPLRTAHDYTTNSPDILNWLSRRWLYNIPRSLQTEGRRALGRLALVDHAGQLVERLRRALEEIMQPEAATASSQATGQTFSNQRPRVFIISSISSGTGGGMVLDVAFAARKLLADLGHADDGLCGILTHSTDRNPAARDLAVANAYATLVELEHYRRSGIYPGEPTLGLGAMEACEGSFPHAYFVHLGDELSDDEFELATDRLASYLVLASATPAAEALDRCRAATLPDQAPTGLDIFGFASIGSMQTPLVGLATERLCKEVVDRWRGGSGEGQSPKAGVGLLDAVAQRATGPDSITIANMEQTVAAHATQLGLELDPLRDAMMTALASGFGADAAGIFARLRADVDNKRGVDSAGPPEKTLQLLRSVRNLFSLPGIAEEGKRPAPTPVPVAVEQGLEKHVGPKAELIRQWILSFVEQPETRLRGALRAKDAYAARLTALEGQANELAREIRQNAQTLELSVIRAHESAPPRRSRFALRRNDKSLTVPYEAVENLIQLRFHETALNGLCKMVRLIASQVAAAGEQLKDLQRDLGQLSRQFATASPWPAADVDSAPSKVADEVALLVAKELCQRLSTLVNKVDEQFEIQVLKGQGGLRSLAQKPEAMRWLVPNGLRAIGRGAVIEALKQIPIAPLVLGGDAPAEVQNQRLEACLQCAKPTWTDCGGARRLLAMLGENAAESRLAQMISGELTAPGTVLTLSSPDFVICNEVQNISLAHVASRLIEERNDYVQIAGRLHTRMDVEWGALAQVAGRNRG